VAGQLEAHIHLPLCKAGCAGVGASSPKYTCPLLQAVGPDAEIGETAINRFIEEEFSAGAGNGGGD